MRDAFVLAKERASAIVFFDGPDATGNKRFDPEKAGDWKVPFTMFELLGQLHGFSSSADIADCDTLPGWASASLLC